MWFTYFAPNVHCDRALEAVEASEVAVADEVTEAAEVLKPGKSLIRTSVSSWFWFSTLF